MGKELAERFGQHYYLDWLDAFNWQVLVAAVAAAVACAVPAVTFGSLLAAYTRDNFGVLETLAAGAIVGVLCAFLSAQPLLLLHVTGPLLIHETAIFTFTRSLGLDFLASRFWCSLWLIAFALCAASTDKLSGLVKKHVTAFSEDVFDALCACVYVLDSIEMIADTFAESPIANLDYYRQEADECDHIHRLHELQVMSHNDSEIIGADCVGHMDPQTSLTTLLTVFLTTGLAYALFQIRKTVYFGRMGRRYMSDLCILLASVIVTLLETLLFPNVHLIRVNVSPALTWQHNHTLIFLDIFYPAHQWWGYLVCIIPAILLFVLLFIETQLAALRLAKADLHLSKPGGPHWDTVVHSIGVLLCASFGLPFMCAGVCASVAHIKALSAYDKRSGDTHVHEQRVSGLMCAFLIASLCFAGNIVEKIPLAVAFGALLFLGITLLMANPFIRRIRLVIVPRKYHNEEPGAMQVSPIRLHLYTCLQLCCLVIILLVKKSKLLAVFFPFGLIALALIRGAILPKIFDEHELNALDGNEDE